MSAMGGKLQPGQHHEQVWKIGIRDKLWVARIATDRGQEGVSPIDAWAGVVRVMGWAVCRYAGLIRGKSEMETKLGT
jgi:hypothetical protein